MADPSRAIRVIRLRSFWQRMRGLIGRPPPAPGEAVWLSPCRQVHTFGMGYAIDVVYLDGDNRVLATQRLAPWRIGRYIWRAHSLLEMRAGEIERVGIGIGDRPHLLDA